MTIKTLTLNFGEIEGVKTWPSMQFTDIRGSLFKVVGSKVFQDFHAKEIFFTSSHANTFRGMHLQIGEHPVNKIVSVLSGSISDFLVDTRSSSTTFLNVLNLELNHSDKKVVYIPSGVAHGYLVRESKTTVMYLYDNNFCSDCDAGFNVSSLPVMNFENTKYIRSERDSLLPSIKEFLVDTLSIEFK